MANIYIYIKPWGNVLSPFITVLEEGALMSEAAAGYHGSNQSKWNGLFKAGLTLSSPHGGQEMGRFSYAQYRWVRQMSFGWEPNFAPGSLGHPAANRACVCPQSRASLDTHSCLCLSTLSQLSMFMLQRIHLLQKAFRRAGHTCVEACLSTLYSPLSWQMSLWLLLFEAFLVKGGKDQPACVLFCFWWSVILEKSLSSVSISLPVWNDGIHCTVVVWLKG